MRKGQAAMEFLMTYGWAILVVLAAIAALAYFGVLSPSRFLPERCDFPAGLTCIDKAVVDGSQNTIVMAMTNNIGGSVNISNIAESSTTTACGAISDITVGGAAPPVTVINGQRFIINVTCSTDLISGDRFKSDLVVTYINSDTGLSHPSTGTVSGKVD